MQISKPNQTKHNKNKAEHEKWQPLITKKRNKQKVTKLGPHKRRHIRRTRKTTQNKNSRTLRRQKRRLIPSSPSRSKNMDQQTRITKKPPLQKTIITKLLRMPRNRHRDPVSLEYHWMA